MWSQQKLFFTKNNIIKIYKCLIAFLSHRFYDFYILITPLFLLFSTTTRRCRRYVYIFIIFLKTFFGFNFIIECKIIIIQIMFLLCVHLTLVLDTHTATRYYYISYTYYYSNIFCVFVIVLCIEEMEVEEDATHMNLEWNQNIYFFLHNLNVTIKHYYNLKIIIPFLFVCFLS